MKPKSDAITRPFDRERSPSLLIPWCKPPSKKSREILLPPSVARRDVRPIKVERRAALLRSIARGRAWLEASSPASRLSRTSPRAINAAFATST